MALALRGASSKQQQQQPTEVLHQPQPRERCSNPFRIPNHNTTSALRNVPELVREKLSHVAFGRQICTNCRRRVYSMLKERNYIKPSARRSGSSNSNANKSQPGPRAEPVSSMAANRRAPAQPAARQQQQPALGRVQPRRGLPPAPITARDVVEQMADITPERTEHSSSNLVENLNRLSQDTMARRNKALLALPPDLCPSKQVCCFCNLTEDNEIKYGKFFHYNGIVTHYYCLLLSSNMEQKGSDDQGILGFLPDDIHKEIRRGKRLICSHCKKNGATLGCCNVKCKRIFHLPCGLKAGSLHQFFGEFRSYCIIHRPKQKIDDRVKKEIEKMSEILCYICYEEVQPLNSNETLWAPCCKKNAWFHRNCVQQLAMSAGYFFKCPLCNNKREFQTAMLEYGIYIPRQDASWELVPNAFEELLYRHDRCDAKICQCPKGKTYSSNNGKWELILCRTCGSQGVHISCGQLKWTNPTWDCEECLTILKKSIGNTNSDSTTNSNQSSRQRFDTVRVSLEENDEDSDSDISVGNEILPTDSSMSNVPIPPVKLRPGPKSFKLQQFQKIKSALTSSSGVSNTSNKVSEAIQNRIKTKSSEVITLDSDDDSPEIVCESSNRSINKFKNFLLFPSQKSSTANSSNSSSNSRIIASIDLASPKAVKTGKPAPTENSDDPSPLNIVITHVTSVPPELFASVPEDPETEVSGDVESLLDSTLETATESQVFQHKPSLKRRRSDVLGDEPEKIKRARLDNEAIVGASKATVETNSNEQKSIPLGQLTLTSPLSRYSQESPSNFAANSSSVLNKRPSNDASSSSHENCHGDASFRPAVYNSSRSHDISDATCSRAATFDERLQSNSEPNVDGGDTATRCQTQSLDVTLENESSPCIGKHGVAIKPRKPIYNRTGLIPDYVYLSDLKFSVHENVVEISYGVCKIQMTIGNASEQSTNKSNDTSSNTNITAGLSHTNSNQNLSSERSASTSLQLRSDESDESFRNLRSLRRRTLRSFVYEDDNTLLEYPTAHNDPPNGHVRVTRKTPHDKNAKFSRSDLKENWDPEVSNSSINNVVDNLNNNQTNSGDLKDIFNLREKSNKLDEDIVPKEDSGTNQNFLRRSHRMVRHFRSIQSPNSLVDSNFVDSNPNNILAQSVEKSNSRGVSDQSSVRSSKSLKVIKSGFDAIEHDKHLQNVDVNNLKLTVMGKVNGIRSNNEIVANGDFKVSIDLKKISKLINAKPELFLKTKRKDVNNSLREYKMDQKLKIESKPGNKTFLTKAQSFECLLDLTRNKPQLTREKSGSLNDVTLISSSSNSSIIKLADKRDCTAKKIRRSQRRKSLRFEKHESVR